MITSGSRTSSKECWGNFHKPSPCSIPTSLTTPSCRVTLSVSSSVYRAAKTNACVVYFMKNILQFCFMSRNTVDAPESDCENRRSLWAFPLNIPPLWLCLSFCPSVCHFLDIGASRLADLRGDSSVRHLWCASAGTCAREDQELLPHKQRQPLPLWQAVPQGAQGPREWVQGTVSQQCHTYTFEWNTG